MKRIHDYDLNTVSTDLNECEVKKSPFSIYEGEFLHRYVVDNPSGIWITDLDKEICKALSTYLVLTSDLISRLLTNQGHSCEKKEIQHHLKKLTLSGYTQKIVFESDIGFSAAKAYILAGRGIGLLNALGIRYRLGGYLAQLDHIGMKRILSSNQLLINGKYDRMQVSGIVLIEPKDEARKSAYLFRPTATCFNQDGEAYQFVDSVRRTASEAELSDKLERIVQVYKQRKNANIKICQNVSVVLVAEDYQHMCELIDQTYKRFGKKLNLKYTYDLAVYSCSDPDDFLFEYSPEKKTAGFFAKAIAACI